MNYKKLMLIIGVILSLLFVFIGGFICGYDFSTKETQAFIFDNQATIYKGVNAIYDTLAEINISCPACPTPYIDYTVSGCYNTFENVLYGMAHQREYELDVYDCTQYANNAAKRLRELGFDAYAFDKTVDCDSELFDNTTCNKYGGNHRIVVVNKVYVEAVTGTIIMPEQYEDYNI